MELQNNIEAKARFFALYFGQRITDYKFVEKLDLANVSSLIKSEEDIDNWCLYIKSLRNITDADLKDLAKYCGVQKAIRHGNFIHLVYENDLVEFYFTSDSTKFPYFLADFFRSKSYFLPYLGMDEDEAILRGWIKIINEINF